MLGCYLVHWQFMFQYFRWEVKTIFQWSFQKNTAFEDVRKTIYITAILVTLVSTIGMLLLKAFIDYDDIFLFLPFIALFRMMRIAQLSEVVYKENPVKFGVSNVGLASLTLFFFFCVY